MAYQLGPEFRDIADKIIDKFPVAFGHIDLDKVLFLKETEKAPKKYADIRKVSGPYTFMTEYKFIMTFYEAPMMGLTDAQKVMVVYHEMLHIDPGFEKLRKHNIEDFRELLSIYGVNWTIDPNLTNIIEDDDATAPSIVVSPMGGTDDDEEELEIL